METWRQSYCKDIEIGMLSYFHVIANQCAHWCGNPFSYMLHIIDSCQ